MRWVKRLLFSKLPKAVGLAYCDSARVYRAVTTGILSFTDSGKGVLHTKHGNCSGPRQFTVGDYCLWLNVAVHKWHATAF